VGECQPAAIGVLRPVLGLIFLRYADHRFAQAEVELARQAKGGQGSRRIGKTDYHAFVTPSPLFSLIFAPVRRRFRAIGHAAGPPSGGAAVFRLTGC
jgi:hypothetical protein